MRWLIVTVVLAATILVPFVLFEDQFNALAADLLAHRMSSWYVGTVVAGLLASDVLLPIPSSLVAAGAGAALGFWRGVAAIWVGMTLACLIGYAFGSRFSRRARRYVGDAGMARADGLSARYGDYAIVLCRPVPVLAEASVIFAGVVGRPFSRFVMMSSWSNLGVALGYAAIGAFSMQADSFLLAFLGSIAVPGLAILASRLWLRVERNAGS